MKILLLLLIVLHGLIHFIGFARFWNIFELKGFMGYTLFVIPGYAHKPLGLLWLACMLLFLLAATRIVSGNYWWALAILAILISQTLIIISWKDAKAGTLANLVILILAVINFADWTFNRFVQSEIREIINKENPAASRTITAASIKELPECVQTWLIVSGAVGRKIKTVCLKQKGKMRTSLTGRWMPADAEQFFNIDDPAFIWKVKVSMNAVIWYSGRDEFKNGLGSMLIKLFSLIPIVNSSGRKIDQGSLLRFMGEMCWFPSAAVSPYIKWESISRNSAKATMCVGSTEASGIFRFDSNGNVLAFSAKRYMANGNSATLEDWYVPCNEWRVLDGFKIPVKGEVIWSLKSGNFSYYKWEITEISYH
ncbi:MAG: DUF6544 family protein [Taibaiella sp.]